MKKNILIVMVFAVMLFSFAQSVFAVEKEREGETNTLNLAPDAKSAILIERDTGKLLFEKEAHEQLPPASMTKIMTLLLIMEELDKGNLNLDEMIRISENASSIGGSQIFLAAGEEMSVEDLLKGISIASGNDASVAMAERISGSEEAFVSKMNEKVRALNLENTHFQNSSGLPAEDHYSSTYDMAMIAKELLKYETITSFTSIYEDYLRKGEENEFWLVNTNKLVKFYPGVDGLKTGYTNEAKYCLTATAKKDNMRVIAIVMGADTVKDRNQTVSQMLDYAFNHFETKKLYDKDQKITSIELLKGETNEVDVVASESMSTLHKKGESTDDLKAEIIVEESFSLPMKKGDQVGEIIIKDKDEIVTTSPLVVNADIDKASYFTLLKRSLQRIIKHSN